MAKFNFTREETFFLKWKVLCKEKIYVRVIFFLECKVSNAESPKQKYAWNIGVTDWE